MKEKPVDGIAEAIEKLHKNHRLVVVSSTISSPIKEYLDKYNISQYFEKIYGADIDVNKSSKIRMVFADFDATPVNCLFITDTLGDMREATRAGIKSVGVSWGFHKLDTLRKGNPVAIANTPGELLSLIDNTL
jgi:phosphoglycolate phosphatase